MRRLLAFILAFAPAALSAATFDFTSGVARSGATLDFVSGDMALSVGGQGGAVTSGGLRGLGIASSRDDRFAATHIESWGEAGEGLSFSFDRHVRIEAVHFSFAHRGDRARMAGAEGAQTFKLPADPWRGSATLLLGTPEWVGREFTLAPETWTFCTLFQGRQMCEERGSGFRVTGIEVSQATPVVPLPASVLMLMGGLAGLAFVGRRRG